MMRHKILRSSIVILLLISSTLIPSCARSTITTTQSAGGETEAATFQGTQLTPIRQQQNNALAGTQHIDEATYKLTVEGLVNKPLTLTYADLQAFPQISKLAELACVEGWSFTAKWTGPSLSDILDAAGVQSGAAIVIFHTADVPSGYSSLDINYIRQNNIIIALKLNDITLPQDRGFPFQVVAEGKYGYKWAKWVTGIEVSSNTNFRGFWESNGYSNDATVGGPGFGPSSIAVTPASPVVLEIGSTLQFTATATYTNSLTADITAQVTWEQSNPSVATLSQYGLATGVSAGTTNITATLSDLNSPAVTLTVVPSTPTLSQSQ